MRYLEFGETKQQASVVGAGCMRIFNLSEQELDSFVHTALEAGVNFFDHADIYGRGACEEAFGNLLKNQPGLRNQLLLQSKCAIHDSSYDFSKDYIIKSVDGILSRLKTDHIDSLLLHRPDALMEPEEVGEAFDKLKTEGKVLNFGVSNENRYQMELLSSGLNVPLAANQMQMSIAFTPMLDAGFNVNTRWDGGVMRDPGTLEYCRMNQIIVQTWSPIQKGYFSGTFIGDPDYPELNQKMEELAAKYEVSVDTIAYAWLLRYPAKMQVITGTTKGERICEAAKAADITLTHQEWYDLYCAAGNKLP